MSEPFFYLSGSTNDALEARLIAAGVGLMNGPTCAYRPERVARFPFWALDNGAFADRWCEDDWIDWLGAQPTERCLFAVSPDVYPDARESLRRGLEYAPILRDMGLPVAVVAQDGAERLHWPFEEMDCVFIGGERRTPRSLEWKVSAEAHGLMARARDAGKWVHVGRCNSLRAVEQARRTGANSADGNFIGKAPETNLVRALHWFDWLAMHSMLPMFRWETPAHANHRAALA